MVIIHASLADEMLEQTEVKICKVNHVTEFFKDYQARPSPLTEEVMLREGVDRYYLPVTLLLLKLLRTSAS